MRHTAAECSTVSFVSTSPSTLRPVARESRHPTLLDDMLPSNARSAGSRTNSRVMKLSFPNLPPNAGMSLRRIAASSRADAPPLGRAWYRRGQTTPTRAYWFERNGTRGAAIGQPGEYAELSLSRDGNHLRSPAEVARGTSSLWKLSARTLCCLQLG
jgi:hypothetical protein